MAATPLDTAARLVLSRFAGLPPAPRLVFLGNRGGFSGARLWRVESAAGPFCLRAWPAGGMTPDRLARIHGLMQAARQAGLDFVPAVVRAADGMTWVEHAGRLWELAAWMPGRADFHDQPTSARLGAACQALARLHAAWSKDTAFRGPCPAVRRRLECVREWLAIVDTGWRPAFPSAHDDRVHGWAERAWRLLLGRIDRVPARLARWCDYPLPLQPCLCDVWHDHVLFEGEAVTGLVDYGSAKIDHVAVDLARLLGSLVGDDPARRASGLAAYSQLRPLAETEEALVMTLDETATLLGATNWLRWLYRDGRVFEDRAAVAGRLAELVRRMEQWR